MKKVERKKKGSLLGALVLGITMMSGMGLTVQAAEDTISQGSNTVVETPEPIYASTDLVIPEGTTEIEDNAFYEMSYTGKLVIPDGVTRIGDYAFYGCGFSGELIIPDSVEYIGEYAFFECNFNGNLMIPDSVQEIGACAFCRCRSFDGIAVMLGEEVVVGRESFGGVIFTDFYIAGSNLIFSDYRFNIFDSSGPVIHAPYNSTARAYVANRNKEYGDEMSFIPWEGRYDVEEMEISADTLPLKLGESKTLTLSVVPAIAADQTFYWESSNENVATVENGVVTAVGYGVATIEAYTAMGDSITCQATVLPFTDVKSSSWEYAGISYVYGRGMMTGTTATEFKPGGKLTRSQFVTVLYSYSGKPDVAYTSRFTDVPNSQWYTKPVLWAAANGVTAGYGDRFGVADNITRAQFVTMLYAYGKKTGAVTDSVSGNLYSFEDYEEVESWSKEALIWATQNGLVSGKIKNGKTYLDPQGTATRAECATIMMQYDRNFGTN